MEHDRAFAMASGMNGSFHKILRCRSLERTYLVTTAAGRALSGSIVVICADPGMGKTHLAMAVARRIPTDSVEVVSLASLEGDLAALRLTKVVHRLSSRLRKGTRMCVVIDDVCPADECSVQDMDKQILRLHRLGAAIIMTMRPEAEQVLDGLDDYFRIGKSDMMVQKAEVVPRLRADAIMKAADGAPELVDVLQTHVSTVGVSDALHPAFGEALSRIAYDSIREQLLPEERMVRFAAMLLGRGTWDELHAATKGLASGEIAPALREAVLINVDYTAKTFRCTGLAEDAGFMYCSDVLERASELWPGCVSGAVGVLVERGDMHRAARIVGWLGDDARCALSLRHGIAFLDAGEVGLVHAALSGAPFAEEVSPYAQDTLEWAFNSIWSPDRQGVRMRRPREFATGQDERDFARALLLDHVRAVMADASCTQMPMPAFSDTMAASLAAHAEAIALLELGRTGECCSLMRMHRPEAVDCYSKALLVIDDEVARVLACDAEPPSAERIRMSEEFFERMGFSPLAGWGGILESVREAIAGTIGQHGLEQAAALAERRGNTALASALCSAVVIADLHRRAPVSAHVRAGHALALAAKAHCAMLSDVAALLQAISADYIEEPAAYRGIARRTWSCPQLSHIADALCSSMSEDDPGVAETPVPYDFLWLVVAIANLPGAFQYRFRAALHPTWRRHLAKLEKSLRVQDDEPQEEPEPPQEEQGSPAPAHEVEIRMLGGFSLLVNGIEVPQKDLVARGAAAVLSLLAVAPAHCLTRVELVDSVWPGVDYLTGRNRIYQAVSRIRRLVKAIDETLEPVGLARNDGMVSLKEGTFRCDIDAFAEEAHRVLEKEGEEEEVVEAAQRTEVLYRGDVQLCSQDGSGLIRRRARELRKLFTDAMVLGSEAALRLGKRRLAVHFAERASMSGGTREDVASALIRALKASGRQDEALEHYRSFVKKASRSRRWRPSVELRDAIGSLVADEKRAGSMRAVSARGA